MDSAHTILMAELSPAGWLQRYRMRRWLRRSPAFVRSCRLFVRHGDSVTLFRMTYVSNCSNYAKAEHRAEEFVGELLQTKAFGSDEVLEVQWKRGRMITHQTLASEDENIQMAVVRLWASQLSELLAYERIDNYPAKAGAA